MSLLMASLWPIRFLEGAANAFRWVNCISGCCCQWLCFGPLFFSEALPIHSDGPIALADAANNCFAWAHQISGRHFGWPIVLADAAVDCFSLAHWVSWRHCQCARMGP